MLSKFIIKKDFYFTFFEQQVVPHFYKGVIYKNIELPLSEYSTNISQVEKTLVTCIELFPTYFIPKTDVPIGFDIKKIFRVKGYCISINNANTIDAYIQANFKPNLRTALRRRLKGLESSFDVHYKLFYGQIDRHEYEFLMKILHGMIVRRFNQRDDKHDALLRWDSYYESVFTLINEKKASLYVIYDDQKPIQISLNYHNDKILFLSVPSYDIDYAKFGLGNIAVHKLLEWCINNKYEILDMGYGAFDYKLKWCNENYDFEHHLFYKKKSILALLMVQLISFKTKLINFLIAKRVNNYYNSIKSLFKKKSEIVDYDYEISPATDLLNVNPETPPIDFINDTSFTFLKKSVYDFLYTNKEHISKIQVFEIKKNESYLIKSQKEAQKVVFQKK